MIMLHAALTAVSEGVSEWLLFNVNSWDYKIQNKEMYFCREKINEMCSYIYNKKWYF